MKMRKAGITARNGASRYIPNSTLRGVIGFLEEEFQPVGNGLKDARTDQPDWGQSGSACRQRPCALGPDVDERSTQEAGERNCTSTTPDDDDPELLPAHSTHPRDPHHRIGPELDSAPGWLNGT